MKTGIYLTAAFVIVALLFTWGSIEGAKVKEEKDRFWRDRICHIDIKDITSAVFAYSWVSVFKNVLLSSPYACHITCLYKLMPAHPTQ